MKEKIIIHVDVNNAFLSWTSVYLLQNGYKKDIRNIYAIIGGDETQRRGIVLAKSNPCKKNNVITGETIKSARKKCPYLEIYSPNYELYKTYSNLMYKYLQTYTNKIERYSIDECFLDYTASQKQFGPPIKIAHKIKEDIKNMYGFTVNVGIGNNKLCAKMASDFQKPDKVHTLFTNEIPIKMWPLPVEDLFMIGKKTSQKLKEQNITTIYTLAHTSEEYLIKKFGKFGILMWQYANGIDNSEVEYTTKNPKSISASTVLPYNYTDINSINNVIYKLAEEVTTKLKNKNMYASNISIWIKYPNFTKISKQIKLNNYVNTPLEIYNYAKELFIKTWNEEPIRAICVGVNNLSYDKNIQLSLFISNEENEKNEKLKKTINNINKKYGKNTITYAKK